MKTLTVLVLALLLPLATAAAECGWLLMMPKRVGALGTLPPLAAWGQVSAHDAAAGCEAWKARLLAVARPVSDAVTENVRAGEFDHLTVEEKAGVTFLYARCLPASSVPLN